MSDCIDVVYFNNNRLQLRMMFEGDDFETASVEFQISAADRGVLQDTIVIPVKCLFDMVHLMGMSLRRTAVQYELEVQEMVDKVEMKKHPFKDK